MANMLTSSTELCVYCQMHPFDTVCSCGDKFSFECIILHAEQIRTEFEDVQDRVEQRLCKSEQIVEENDCNAARAIIENWVCINFVKLINLLSSIIITRLFLIKLSVLM